MHPAGPDRPGPPRVVHDRERERVLDEANELASGQLLDFLPPLRPAAAFWALLPPLPDPLLLALRLLPLLFPPRLDEPGEFEIAAARDLLMPFLRRPSYCVSFLTLEPW